MTTQNTKPEQCLNKELGNESMRDLLAKVYAISAKSVHIDKELRNDHSSIEKWKFLLQNRFQIVQAKTSGWEVILGKRSQRNTTRSSKCAVKNGNYWSPVWKGLSNVINAKFREREKGKRMEHTVFPILFAFLCGNKKKSLVHVLTQTK